MNFSSDAIAKIEGLLEVNRDFCKQQMAEKTFARWLPNESEIPTGTVAIVSENHAIVKNYYAFVTS